MRRAHLAGATAGTAVHLARLALMQPGESGKVKMPMSKEEVEKEKRLAGLRGQTWRVVKALACWHHMKWEVRERTRQKGAQPACGASEGPARGGAGAAHEGEQAGASGATDERADDEQDEDGDTKSSRRGQRIRKLDDAKTGIENKRRKTSATTRRWTRLDILQAGAAIMDDVDAEWRGWRG